MVPKRSSSALLNNAFAWTAATISGCKFLMAARAIRDTIGSYSKACHLCWISWKVNLQENFTPLSTMRKSFVCKTPRARAKSSVGFQRPRSLVDAENEWRPCLCLPLPP